MTFYSQKRINHFQSSKFVWCDCNDEHKDFAIYCFNSSYNANYYCFAEDNDIFCGFCLTLKSTLNENIYKSCIVEERKDDLGRELIPLNEYFYKKIKASLFYFYF